MNSVSIIFYLMPEWVTGFNFLLALFGFLVLVAAAAVVVLANSRKGLSELQIERATAAEGILKLRDATITEKDIELTKAYAKIEALEEEIESVTAEHRALAGMSIAKLMEFWAMKENIEATMADLQREIRILKLRKDGTNE